MSEHDPIEHLIELRGVYDGWSIAVHKDGTLHNRWTGEDGNAIPGYERRWEATEKAIEEIRDKEKARWPVTESVETLADALHAEVVRQNPGHADWTNCPIDGPCAEDATGLIAAGAVRPADEVRAEGAQEWRPRHGTVEDDLRSRLLCVLEATYWDRPYDERIGAIRGMCDLTTNGMTPLDRATPVVEREKAEARAEGVAALLAEAENRQFPAPAQAALREDNGYVSMTTLRLCAAALAEEDDRR